MKLVRELIAYDKAKHGGLKQNEIERNMGYLFLTEYWADPFIVSLCKEREDRSMWEHYADHGEGVCLEFAVDELRALKGVSLQECLYAPVEGNFLDEASLNSIYDYVVSIPSSPKIIIPYPQWSACVDMLIRTKRTDYESEAECRLVKCSEIWNHAQNNFDRPYVELSIPSTALRGITLAPARLLRNRFPRLVSARVPSGTSLNQ